MNRVVLSLSGLFLAASASAVQFLVNSPATYLRAVGESPFFANAIDLNANGFFAGQTVLVSRAGSWNHLGGGTPTDFGLSAVFSSSNVLLPTNLLNRVPGALATGAPAWVSANTLVGNVNTDIAEDFQVDNQTGTANGVVLVIPTGALFLFATAQDNFFQDNNNTTEFYISLQPVPEPASLLAIGVGLAVVARRRFGRFQS